MEIWNYHPITNEFVAKSLADESPLEPGVFLIPAHATTVPAPEQSREGFAIVFDGGKWIYVEDHRGEEWWDKDGKKIIIEELGPINTEELTEFDPTPVRPSIPPTSLQDLPPEERLKATGLTVEELKQLLGLS